MNPKSLVVLTGAGISAESGLQTFRSQNGYWNNHRVEDVASITGYRKNPTLVNEFYNERRKALQSPDIRPNAAHLALRELETSWPGKFLLITQNVDDLHDRAGHQKLFHMHGELLRVRCEGCEETTEWLGDLLHNQHACQSCGEKMLRPHIVWFGEVPFFLEEIYAALRECDLFVSIGTSGLVYPAASFVSLVPKKARTIEVNVEGSVIASAFHEHRLGPATQTVPKLVADLLHEYR